MDHPPGPGHSFDHGDGICQLYILVFYFFALTSLIYLEFKILLSAALNARLY